MKLMRQYAAILLSTLVLSLLLPCPPANGGTLNFDYSTYLGGDAEDRAYSVAIDASRCAYITGPPGTCEAWGSNGNGQCNVPAPNNDFVQVAGGYSHSLGLKSDGTVVTWGWNGYGQCNIPAPNNDFVQVAGGYYHSLGLKSNGTVVAWGRNNEGQCNVPSPNSSFVQVSGGADGTALASSRTAFYTLETEEVLT